MACSAFSYSALLSVMAIMSAHCRAKSERRPTIAKPPASKSL